MKKIFNFLKTLLYSIWSAIAGGCIVLNVYYIIKNIQAINTGSGWTVVLSFVLALMETIITVILLYELGTIQLNSNQWIAYKKTIATQTIDGSPEDYESSDEATDISSDKKS
jgi:hypothetical protein